MNTARSISRDNKKNRSQLRSLLTEDLVDRYKSTSQYPLDHRTETKRKKSQKHMLYQKNVSQLRPLLSHEVDSQRGDSIERDRAAMCRGAGSIDNINR